MSITLPSEDTVFQYYIQLFQAQNSTWDLSDKSFFGLLARAMAQGTMLLMDSVYDADSDSVPAYAQDSDGTLLSRCSAAALDSWAITYGLPSGVSGVFGRKGAQGSSGGIGLPTCSIGGTVIPIGSQLVDSTGQVVVQTTAAITTDGPPNTIVVNLESVTTGAAANLPVGSILTWSVAIAGLSSTMTLTSPLTGGTDRETDGSLLARILFRLQNPPRGGTAADYRYWVESSTDSTQNNKSNNITRGYVYPLRSGASSVDVVGLVSGAGTGRIPSAGTINAMQTYLDGVRPVTATVNALTPSMPAAKALRVQVIPEPHDLYAYDWDDGTLSTAIKAGSTTTTVVILTVNFKANLKNAIDNGQNPRIQIVNTTTGATVQPYVRQVTSYQTNVPAAGDTTLILGSAMGVAPTAGDRFYAGGPIVETIADNIVAYVDSLGPSRESGFADEFDPWEYQVTIARLADIVMEARDTNGTRMVKNIPRLTTTGVTIAVGAGAFNALSYTPLDILVPEIAYLRTGGIEVIKYTP